MDQELNSLDTLDLMIHPGFCVKDGKIVNCNASALSLLLREGMEIAPLLATGQAEYAEFSDGCLHLMLDISGVRVGASVYRKGDYQVFVLDEEPEQAELNAMALAARELREPLSGIMTTADRLFPMKALQEDPALQEQVARMNRGLYQMLRIICNMSDAGRYSAPSSAQLKTTEITAFLQEIFDRSRELTAHGGITLRFENLSQRVYTLVDQEKLERAVMNILSNAMKFTPAGGTIEAKLTRRGTRLYLTVQDSGEGIPDAIRGSIHRRYQRQPGHEDSRYGIGLGLVLIRSAAAVHGGAVLMDQPEGSGNRITLTLAIRQDTSGIVRSNVLTVDYAGEWDHALLELSENLPAALYGSEHIN